MRRTLTSSSMVLAAALVCIGASCSSTDDEPAATSTTGTEVDAQDGPAPDCEAQRRTLEVALQANLADRGELPETLEELQEPGGVVAPDLELLDWDYELTDDGRDYSLDGPC